MGVCIELARHHEYFRKPRQRYLEDFEKFLLHSLSSFRGDELPKIRGYASRQELSNFGSGYPFSPHSSSERLVDDADACLDDETKLEILERRIHSLEHLFHSPQHMWKTHFRNNVATGLPPPPGRAVFRD